MFYILVRPEEDSDYDELYILKTNLYVMVSFHMYSFDIIRFIFYTLYHIFSPRDSSIINIIIRCNVVRKLSFLPLDLFLLPLFLLFLA